MVATEFSEMLKDSRGSWSGACPHPEELLFREEWMFEGRVVLFGVRKLLTSFVGLSRATAPGWG